MECWGNECEWTNDKTCIQPAYIPGELCWGLDTYDCNYDHECITAAEFDDFEPEDNDDGPPDCMLDGDPACNFPDGLDADSYSFIFKAEDSAGNSNTKSMTFSVS